MFTMIHDLPAADGRTIKENNLDLKHQIPIGALVEFELPQWFGGGACQYMRARLYVVRHTRDCDGTPLYVLSRWKDHDFTAKYSSGYAVGGISEEALTVVEVTPRVLEGEDLPAWYREES